MADLLEDADGAPYPEQIQRIWAVLGDESIDPLVKILTDVDIEVRRSDVGHMLDYLKNQVRAACAPEPPMHLMRPPSEADLRWTCSVCNWTASEAFTTPEIRGAMWFQKHGAMPMMADG
jgi:hypothetical protein